MNANILELIWRCFCLLAAVVVLPAVYTWVLYGLREENNSALRRFELFVGFGAVGGWFLIFALVGGVPFITVPMAVFQILIALPLSIFCLLRLAFRAAPSSYRTTAIAMLAAALLLPLVALLLSLVQGPRIQ